MMFHNMDMIMVLLLVLNNAFWKTYATCLVGSGRNVLLQSQRELNPNVTLIT